jgi:hypothetical protein
MGEYPVPMKRCFVAAPPEWLASLRPLLAEAALEPVVATDLPLAGATASEAVTNAVSSADVVLAVVTESIGSPNVFFELGQAVALGKPAILLAAPGVSVPSDLHGMLVLRLAPDVGESLRFAVEQLREARPEWRARPGRRASPEKEHPLGPEAQRWLSQVPPNAPPRHDVLVRSVVEALNSSGIKAVEALAGDDQDFDLAVWSPNLAWLDANPLPVEIKTEMLSSEEARRTAELLLRRLARTPAGWALLLYGAGPEGSSLEPAMRAYPVLAMRVDELLGQLEKDTLPEVIRRLRNERVHGGAQV